MLGYVKESHFRQPLRFPWEQRYAFVQHRERADQSRPFLRRLRARTTGDGPRSRKAAVPGAGLRRGRASWRLLCEWANPGLSARLDAARTGAQNDDVARETLQHSLL